MSVIPIGDVELRLALLMLCIATITQLVSCSIFTVVAPLPK